MLSEIKSYFSSLSQQGIKNIIFYPNFVPLLLNGYSIDELNRFFYSSMTSNFDTVALSSDSLNLCGTDDIFYCNDTLSSGRSSFVNYIITNRRFERSFHPYVSTVFFGKTNGVVPYLSSSLHGYGKNTPYDYMQQNNFHVLTLNMPIRMSTLVHHSEYIANVPYRYIKLFKHRCATSLGQKVTKNTYCLNVLIESLRYNIYRDYGENLWNLAHLSRYQSTHSFKQLRFDLMLFNDFVNSTVDVLTSNPSSWLSEQR